MPKKLRPAVDLMAFRCRTLKVRISKTAPTCFGLQGNHHQGATVSTWLKITHLVKSRYIEAVQDVVSVIL
jgi:hypothetical protein